MDDRSERLRRRRKQSTGRSDGSPEPDETSDTTESPETSEPSEPSKPSDSPPDAGDSGGGDDGDGDGDPRSIPVKEQQTGTYMYLPESQVKRLRRQYNVLKAEYEFRYDEEFEKNRHFYPLVVRYGLERLDELDVEQIRSRLEEFYE